jgi:gamma-glutamyltranspeptidase/glutathione hydrolase
MASIQAKTADLIVAEMNAGKGIMTQADLQNYHSVWRNAHHRRLYKGYKIITMPPPSSGGHSLDCSCTENLPNATPLKRWGFNKDSTVQLIVEAERRVYADRSKYLGDPDFYKVPEDSLLETPIYIISRMANFSWDAATPSSHHTARRRL